MVRVGPFEYRGDPGEVISVRLMLNNQYVGYASTGIEESYVNEHSEDHEYTLSFRLGDYLSYVCVSTFIRFDPVNTHIVISGLGEEINEVVSFSPDVRGAEHRTVLTFTTFAFKKDLVGPPNETLLDYFFPLDTPGGGGLSYDEDVPDTDSSGKAERVTVFFATDRAVSEEEGVHYGGRPSGTGTLLFGECVVNIPPSHRVGRLESPSILRLEFKPDSRKHVLLESVTRLSDHDFSRRITDEIRDSPNREMFVFVHGYNVTFADAARRTAQIKFDLNFQGPAILYSWPALGGWEDYQADEASVIWSRGHFEEFLTRFSQESGADKIHVIAHSMGNRLVCDALERAYLRENTPSRPLLHHLILTAPDIDADTFQQLATAIRTHTRRITLYSSNRDKALILSEALHQKRRAGQPIIVHPAIDSIDASAVNTDFLTHGYFAQDRSVLEDIHSLMILDTPPENRFQLKRVRDVNGDYYAFRS